MTGRCDNAANRIAETNLDKLCQYLSNRLRSNEKDAHDTYHEHNTTDRCLALFALALAGKGEPAYDEQFYNRRETLNAEDRTLVALAIIENKGPAAMVKALLQPAPQEKAATENWDEFANPATVEGMRLLAWCRFQPRGRGHRRPVGPVAGSAGGARRVANDPEQRLGAAGVVDLRA